MFINIQNQDLQEPETGDLVPVHLSLRIGDQGFCLRRINMRIPVTYWLSYDVKYLETNISVNIKDI